MKDAIQKTLRDEGFKKILLLIVFSLLTSVAITQKFSIESLSGSFFAAVLLLIILYKDIQRYKPAYLKGNNMLFLLGFMVAGTLFIGRFSGFMLAKLAKGFGIVHAESALFGIPIPLGAMLVALLFDFHTALSFSFVVSLLSGLWLNDALYPVYAFVGSLTASFSMLRCKRRSAILKGGFYVSLVNVLTVSILLLFSGWFVSAKLYPSLAFAFSAGISVIAIVSLLLPILEHLFKVTTDISLLELIDLEQPLMKNMMIAAPGTYHHSIIVGNLVESAAEAIGVNPLLARVSAYYHDIGKIKMPDYFIENQSGSLSRHDRISPHMSSMIITSHVKEGVELAEQYKLPQPIIDIIQQHHGTSVVTYFYQKSKEYQGEQPSEEDYKYPGPKPQTRVAALVMMADAVEAASRVLSDPTPSRITALNDKIINHIFLEGQLDDCELTLKDISLIKKHFAHILTAILHKRVNYPGFDLSLLKSKPEEIFTGTNEDFYKKFTKTSKNRPEKNK